MPIECYEHQRLLKGLTLILLHVVILRSFSKYFEYCVFILASVTVPPAYHRDDSNCSHELLDELSFTRASTQSKESRVAASSTSISPLTFSISRKLHSLYTQRFSLVRFSIS